MARALFRKDGMLGLNLCRKFIHDERSEQTAENLFRHLDHGMELGGEDHVGFGCDIDGIGGDYPPPLVTECSIHDQLIEMMLCHGYSEGLVRKVAGENHLAFLKKYL
jgi:membrane dipeptidase